MHIARCCELIIHSLGVLECVLRDIFSSTGFLQGLFGHFHAWVLCTCDYYYKTHKLATQQQGTADLYKPDLWYLCCDLCCRSLWNSSLAGTIPAQISVLTALTNLCAIELVLAMCTCLVSRACDVLGLSVIISFKVLYRPWSQAWWSWNICESWLFSLVLVKAFPHFSFNEWW